MCRTTRDAAETGSGTVPPHGGEPAGTDATIGFRYAHIDFLAALALMGLITAHQVRRIRALASLIDGDRES